MDRYWLLTSTFYGNWLPGDPRGFVSSVRDARPGDDTSVRHEHDTPGTEYDRDIPGLQRSAQARLKGPPIRLLLAQAQTLLTQFRETAAHRKWQLIAVAVMTNHVHLVVGVNGDPNPKRVLDDFKAWGSRALNENWGRPPSRRWWTKSGSRRKLKDKNAILRATLYVLRQRDALIVWCPDGITARLTELGFSLRRRVK